MGNSKFNFFVLLKSFYSRFIDSYYSRFLKIYYSFWSLFVIAVMLLSLFLSFDYTTPVNKKGKQEKTLTVVGGNISSITEANYFLQFVPNIKEKYQPATLFNEISRLKIKNQSIVIVKIIWIALVLGLFVAVFSRARHGRFFVPLVGLFSSFIFMLMISFWEKSIFPQTFSFQPGLRQALLPGGMPASLSSFLATLNLFLTINIIINLFVLFHSATGKYFSNHNILPFLLPLEQRSDFELKLYHGKKKAPFLKEGFFMVIHLLILLLFALLIGNVLYVPIFLAQVHNPELTLYISIFALAFIQLFYLYGYISALNSTVSSSTISPWKKVLLSLSFLSYKFMKNMTRVLVYSSGIVTLIIILLLIILFNLSILESYQILPIKPGL